MIDAEQIISVGVYSHRSEEQIRKAVPSPVTVVEFLKLGTIDPIDKINTALTGLFVSNRIAAQFAINCAKRVLVLERQNGRGPDERLWCAIRTGEDYLSGEARFGDTVVAGASVKDAISEANQAAKEATERICSEADYIARMSRSGNFSEANCAIRKTQDSISKASAADASRCAAHSVFHAISAVNNINSRNQHYCSMNARLAASMATSSVSASTRAKEPNERWSDSNAWREEVHRQCDHLIDLVEKENGGK